MKRILLLTIAVVLSFAGIKAEDKISTISVSGYAEKLVEPDEITLDIYVEKAALKNKMEIVDAEKAMLKILKNMGVNADKNFRVKGMGSSTKIGFIKNKNLQTASFSLKLNKAQDVSEFIFEAEKLNIKSIEIEKVDVSKREEIQMELRAEAIKKAKATATTLAEAIDQSIGKAITITDQTSYTNYRYRAPMYSKSIANSESVADGADNVRTSLKFEELKLEAHVSAEFELK